MRKIILATLLATVSLFANKALYDANCAACHGADGKTKALDKSGVIAGMGAGAIENAVKAYKAGKQNKYGEGATMSGSVSAISDADIKSISEYAGSLK
jgi:cytochrome c553